MSGDDRRFFSGSTLAQAVMGAARHFHLPPEELEFRLREKKHGFTHKARGVVIEVDPGAPGRKRESGTDSSASGRLGAREAATSGANAVAVALSRRRSGGPERAPGRRTMERAERRVVSARETDLDPVRAAAEAAARLGAFDVELAVLLAAEEVRVEIRGRDAEWLAGRGAEELEAFEDLVRRMARAADGAGIPVVIDPLGLRGEREGELRSLALAAAAAVRRTGRPVELDPLPAAERRVIHLALAGVEDLATESRGEGAERRLEIRPR